MRWGWRGIEVWTALSALGVTSILRAALKLLVGGWVWWEQLLLFGGIFFLLSGILIFLSPMLKGLFGRKAQLHTGIEFYENRHQLAEQRGLFLKEISQTEYVWLAMWVGTTLVQSGILKTHKVAKLVLHHPLYNLLKVYAVMEKGHLQTYQNNIISVTEDALRNDVPVWWCQRPLVGLVIANAEVTSRDVRKWARIDDYIPYLRPESNPSYTVNEDTHPQLFNQIVTSYKEIINPARNTEDTLIRVNETILAAVKNKLGWEETTT